MLVHVLVLVYEPDCMQSLHLKVKQVYLHAQVYNRMSTRAGLKDHSAVLNLMIAKIANNLKVYSECDDIIQATLGLFQVRFHHPRQCMGRCSALHSVARSIMA